MWAAPFLKFDTHNILFIAQCFVSPKGPSSMISLNNTSTLYRKYLTTSTGLLFNKSNKIHRFYSLSFLVSRQ